MLILSILFLAVLVIPVLDRQLSPAGNKAIAVVGDVIWVIFVIEYLIRFAIAQRRGAFVLHNIPDLLAVAVPVLRPVRLVRLARLARFTRSGALVARTARFGRGRLDRQIAIQTTMTAILVLFVAAVGVFDVERDAPDGNIHTLGDAAWWAITTVTTVGYGDRYPVTNEGRLIAVGLMLTGIAVLGVITASIASWFVGSLQAVERADTEQAARQQRLEVALTEALDRLARVEAHLGTDPGLPIDHPPAPGGPA